MCLAWFVMCVSRRNLPNEMQCLWFHDTSDCTFWSPSRVNNEIGVMEWWILLMLQYPIRFNLQSLQCSWVYVGVSLARSSPWFPVPQACQRQCPLQVVCPMHFLLGGCVLLLVIAIIFIGYGNILLYLLMSQGSFLVLAITFFLHMTLRWQHPKVVQAAARPPHLGCK